MSTPGKPFLIDLSKIDLNRVLAGPEEFRKYIPQRFEMEQLTALVWEDVENHCAVGYKDVTHDEFWVKGHMPGMPLMPGVLMLEAAAQMCSYFVRRHGLFQESLLGFGGLENVSFRNFVVPGDRLYLLSKLTKYRPGRMVICDFQGVVRNTLVVEGVLKGIVLPVDALKQALKGGSS